MPTYVYEHVAGRCRLGAGFEVEQPISAAPLKKCRNCGKPVRRVITGGFLVKAPPSASDLAGKGFTKLVRRDQGVYENVTATGKESRYVKAGQPGTMPHLKKKIRD